MKLYLNSLLVGLVTFAWASMAWLGDIQYVSVLMSLDQPKPWVYRQVVPFLVRLISLSGLRLDYSLILVVSITGVAFYLSLRKLYFHYYSITDQRELYIMGSVFGGMALLGYSRTVYDLMTAFTFTSALYYLVTVQNWKYLAVFTLACLNRETAFLLILVYVVMLLYYRRYGAKYSWWMTACQIYIYGVITYCLRVMFQYNAGFSTWIRPIPNLISYANHPYITVVYLVVLGVILWRVFAGWNEKFHSLKLMFVVIAPILFGMFVVCGYPYEIRIFWEVYPLVVMLI